MAAKSNVSMVFISGEARLTQPVTYGGVATRGLLGGEAFVENFFVPPILIARLTSE